MKIHIFVIVGLMAMTSLAFSQVDTMRLLEVGSVTAPGAITNWYFEDLNGDSIKEIILTTANSVNIYSGSTFAPIWSQSGFTNPKDLNFADINNDGLIDFSVKDTSHIYLIDPHHSTTIWTSPMLDSLYRCYTIGDRNGDGWEDIALVMKTAFANISGIPDTDTVWIDIYNGPAYYQEERYFAYSINVTHAGPVYCDRSFDIPNKIRFVKLNINGLLESRYLLFITKYYWYFSADAQTRTEYNGSLFVFHPDQHRYYSQIDSVGFYISHDLESIGASTRLYTLFGYNNHWVSSPYSNYISEYYDLRSIDNDTCQLISNIWARSFSNSESSWMGFHVGDMNSNYLGDELFFGDADSIWLKTYPALTPIWSAGSEAPGEAGHWFISSFLSPIENITDSNWIAITLQGISGANKCKLINASTGEFSYVILTSLPIQGVYNCGPDYSYLFFGVAVDLIHFYTIAPYITIDNSNFTPSTFFLAPNYPNPFNASTMIEYGLPESGPVKVDIFDILGRKIQTLVDETQAVGYHQVIWNSDDVPSGTYFYRIQAGEKTQTTKCLLLK